MQPLQKDLRNKLERTVREARDIAEAAARSALEHLGVGEANPYGHLNKEERDLRRRLRIHGRQLGDSRDTKTEKQEIDRLVEEVAYEHWHRMLFARFLAENDLLMYPDPDNPVPVTLQECEDLAAEEGASNGWELASKFAARMLPQIFRPDSPVFELILPPESQQALERLLDDLPPEVFTASDSLGWVYQFWQAKRKDEVNASEVKIGARELPAVTQLFTEPYMVSFLLDYSLGAWWAAHRLSEDDLMSTESEEELRSKASLPGVPLEYLRFVKDEDGRWTPAAGTFDGWPEHLGELKTMDPCCGSGHFLVSALLMLVPMRMELEGLSAKDAVDAVLSENIHGLEIDQRCVEIAAFNLALAAWRFPAAGGYRTLPKLNLACSGLSVSIAKEEWKSLALDKHNLRIALDWLHEEFKDAPVLGSLINPARSDAAKLVEWDELEPALEEALSREQTDEQHEMSVVAHGLAEAARLLGGKYHWVITNVPYVGRGKQTDVLKDYSERWYFDARYDLATVFVIRCLELCQEHGISAVVVPQNWLFLTSYQALRQNLLVDRSWNFIALLGPKAFQTQMWDFNVQLLILKNTNEDPLHLIYGIDIATSRFVEEKPFLLQTSKIKSVSQANQMRNPDTRVALEEISAAVYLGTYVEVPQGIKTGDDNQFRLNYWELDHITGWRRYQSTPDASNERTCSGMTYIIRWTNEGNDLARRQGEYAWGRKGVAISQMSEMPWAYYYGDIQDSNINVVVPKDDLNLVPITAFVTSSEFNDAVRRIDYKLSVTNATFKRVPFELDQWQEVAEAKYPNGFPMPFSDDPTQWVFHGHITPSEHPLQVAVARLLGYRWPAELDSEMELADEAREWVERCESLLPYADADGIVCIPPVKGEASADDRLLDLLAAAYGDKWAAGKMDELLKQADHTGKTMETWLRDKFFAQHCKLFHNRPFIWHIWDGLRDGFSVLVNYHKLDNKRLETLIYTYLGDWMNRQKADIASGVDGAQERLAAAENLKKLLELILKGESPYDIFVRWKPIGEQPTGWDPDLNDGVRLNIRPFMSVPDVGKRGAGVLRDKPNINWNKDRGKDVESAPWHHKFKGERINDHHLTLEEKSAAKEKKKVG